MCGFSVTKALPSNNLARLLAQHDPAGNILRGSHLPALTEALSRQDELLGNLRHPALDALTKLQQWPDISATLHAARRADQLSQTLANAFRVDDSVLRAARDALAATDVFAKYRELDHGLKRTILNANRAVLPSRDLVSSIAERTLAALQPTRALADMTKAHQTVLSRMAKLTTPWAIENHPALSAAGFVRIVRLRETAAEKAPYESAVSEVYGEELGEPVAYDPTGTAETREADMIEAGTNPELVAFPTSAFPLVLVVAGFRFNLPPLEAPTSDGGDSSGSFDPQHRLLLDYVEHCLRTFIEARLGRVAGQAWVRRRVSEALRNKWRNRRQQDHDRRGDSYPLIYYADLMDLSDVICQNNNWEDAFRSVFKHKGEVQFGMQRLMPIRNALSHTRPLTRADQLFLSCEAYRLLRALGVLR